MLWLDLVKSERAFADARQAGTFGIAVDDEDLFAFAAGENDFDNAKEQDKALDGGGPLVARVKVGAQGRAGQEGFDLATGEGTIVLHGTDDEAVAGPGERHHDEDDSDLNQGEAGVLLEQADRDQDEHTAPQAGAVQGEQAGTDEGSEVRLLAEQLEGAGRYDGAEQEDAADPKGKGERANGAEQRLHGDQFRLLVRVWSLEKSGEGLQRRSLAAFLWMMRRRAEWARRLVMLSAADEATAVAMAMLAAGGAVLWTCPDEATLRASGLDGLSDFQVTTLSEALRILKNEIRKGLPVSVAVLDAERTVWAEAVTRGVQPDALLADGPDGDAAGVLVERGAERLPVPETAGIAEHVAGNWRERRDGDAALMEGVRELPGPERAIAERWLRAAPRLFPRATVRCYVEGWAASKENR